MRVVMMGTGTFAEPTFEALLARPRLVVGMVTQPDRPTGEKRGSTRQTGRGMKQLALDAGIPVLQPESVNTPEGVAALRELQPHLLVVAAYGQILSPEVLSVPPLGGINVHASLLPRYRGAAPVAWAIWKGEIKTGVTIIRLTAGLDAGEILEQESLDILPDETAGELESRLAPLGAKLALEVVEKLQHGPVPGVKQDHAQVTKAPKLKKEMGLIDWLKPAEEVCRQIRAMQPWPTAYTFLYRAEQPPLRLIVYRARPFVAATGSGLSPSSAQAQRPGVAKPLDLAEFHDLEYVDVSELNIPRSVVGLVPEALARENGVMPLSFDGNILKIATSEPDNYDTLQKLQFILKKDLQPILAERDQIVSAIERHYSRPGSTSAANASGAVFVDNGRVIVRTEASESGGGKVEILELQPSGKKRLSAAEFLRGYPVQPGDRLGPEHH